jgi:hypothetical protein
MEATIEVVSDTERVLLIAEVDAVLDLLKYRDIITTSEMTDALLDIRNSLTQVGVSEN